MSCRQFILLSFFLHRNPFHIVFLTPFLSDTVHGQRFTLTFWEFAATSVPDHGFRQRPCELPHALPWVDAAAAAMPGRLDLCVKLVLYLLVSNLGSVSQLPWYIFGKQCSEGCIWAHTVKLHAVLWKSKAGSKTLQWQHQPVAFPVSVCVVTGGWLRNF